MLTAKIKQATQLQSYQEDKRQRLQKYSKKVVIHRLEKAWEKYALTRLTIGEDEAMSKILSHQSIQKLIKDTSNRFYYDWNFSTRLSSHDLLSVCYEKAWKTIYNYTPHEKFFLYEHLKRGLHTACIDFLRTEGLTKDRSTHRNAKHHRAVDVSLDNEVQDSFNLEGEFILHTSIKEAMQSLEEDELKVFQLFMDSDNVEKFTLEDICNHMGLKYPQQAKRIRDRLADKLRKVCFNY